jgi:hypothetical protein
MRYPTTVLAFAAALITAAAYAQPRDDADAPAAADAALDTQDSHAAPEVAPEASAETPEIVVEGDAKGDPVDLDADAIEAAVRASLNASTPVAEGQIDIEARDDGTVTLSGTVPSAEQKQLVETVAANSPAVRALRSQLVVREPGQLPPETPAAN